MSIVVRDVREHELDLVLTLNNAAGPAILPLDAERLHRLFVTADYFRIAERDGGIAGFLIGFGPNADYDSSNYRWFRERNRSFFYIDRIVVANRRRGGGVGRACYADVQSFAELRFPLLACEVLIEHDNESVRLFHGGFGFHEVGQHWMPGQDQSDIRTSMLIKELCSYSWIQQTYGRNLPDVPWLSTGRHIDSARRVTEA